RRAAVVRRLPGRLRMGGEVDRPPHRGPGEDHPQGHAGDGQPQPPQPAPAQPLTQPLQLPRRTSYPTVTRWIVHGLTFPGSQSSVGSRQQGRSQQRPCESSGCLLSSLLPPAYGLLPAADAISASVRIGTSCCPVIPGGAPPPPPPAGRGPPR